MTSRLAVILCCLLMTGSRVIRTTLLMDAVAGLSGCLGVVREAEGVGEERLGWKAAVTDEVGAGGVDHCRRATGINLVAGGQTHAGAGGYARQAASVSFWPAVRGECFTCVKLRHHLFMAC